MQNSLDLSVAAEARALVARRQTSQTDLAARLGKPQQWLSRRLTGSVPFTVGELIDLAKVLEIDVAELLPTVAA